MRRCRPWFEQFATRTAAEPMPVIEASRTVPTGNVPTPSNVASIPPSERSRVWPRAVPPGWCSVTGISQGRRSWRRRSPISVWRRKMVKRVFNSEASCTMEMLERSTISLCPLAAAAACSISTAPSATAVTNCEETAALRASSDVVEFCSTAAAATAPNTGCTFSTMVTIWFTARSIGLRHSGACRSARRSRRSPSASRPKAP